MTNAQVYLAIGVPNLANAVMFGRLCAYLRVRFENIHRQFDAIPAFRCDRPALRRHAWSLRGTALVSSRYRVTDSGTIAARFEFGAWQCKDLSGCPSGDTTRKDR